MEALEKAIGYTFRDKQLLKRALTHSSYANENRARGVECNERLEFLGDSVLGQVTATHLYLTFPHMPEGQMTRLRAQLVCEGSLYAVARQIALGDFIRLGRGEEHTGGRHRESILADAVEAIIAAMYLDGGLEQASDFIHRFILDGADIRDDHPISDYKTALQELVQRKSGQSLAYETVSESGPDHKKTFTVSVSLNGRAVGEGSGRTKKEAEQLAAKSALEELSQ